MGRKGLILGGARFHGFLLAEHLSKIGDELYVLNRGKFNPFYSFPVKHLIADRNDPEQMEHVLLGANFDYTIDNNAYTPSHVESFLNIMGEKCGHYIFTSSGTVYLRLSSKKKICEKDSDGIQYGAYPKDIKNYATNKFATEQGIGKFKCPRKTIIRFPNIFGERDFNGKLLFFDLKMNDGGKMLLEQEVNRFSLLYSGDIPGIYDSIIQNEKCFGETINISDPKSYNYHEFFSSIYSKKYSKDIIILLPAEKMWNLGYSLPFAWGAELDTSLSEKLIKVCYTPLEIWGKKTLEWELKNIDERKKLEYMTAREKELKIIKETR
jgi:nucleoside-diphosphate-sugar epimerase